jgi:hypothetical protein
MTEKVRQTAKETTDYGAERDRARDAFGDLLDEAVKLEESGVPAKRLNQKNVQAAKTYYWWWSKKKREALFRPFAVIGLFAIFGYLAASPSFDDLFLPGLVLGVYVAYRWLEESESTNLHYTRSMLGNISHLDDPKRFVEGITMEVFGKIEKFQSVGYAVNFGILFALFGAGVFFFTRGGMPLLGQILIGIGLFWGIYAILRRYVVSEKLEASNEDNGDEQ